jgi:hypothetical protein
MKYIKLFENYNKNIFYYKSLDDLKIKLENYKGNNPHKDIWGDNIKIGNIIYNYFGLSGGDENIEEITFVNKNDEDDYFVIVYKITNDIFKFLNIGKY